VSSNKNILVDFSNIANETIDKAKSGTRIDRTDITDRARKKLGKDAFTDMNAHDMLTVLCRARSDVVVIKKGKEGGTFKR